MEKQAITFVGVYSAQAAKRYGTVFWSTPDGREVEITSAQPEGEPFDWPDSVSVGPVASWVRGTLYMHPKGVC